MSTATSPVDILKAIADAETQQMAATLNMSVSRARRMIAASRQAAEREEVEARYGPGSYVEEQPVPREVPVDEILTRVRAAQALDPELSLSEIARQIGMDKGDLRRALGLKPRQDGRLSTTISCDTAVRVIRAIGLAPCEVPGL
jgi:hypothetical protein